jgi:hypothetical protein
MKRAVIASLFTALCLLSACGRTAAPEETETIYAEPTAELTPAPTPGPDQFVFSRGTSRSLTAARPWRLWARL